MISYVTYKFVHLIGIFLILSGLIAAIMSKELVGGKSEKTRRLVALTHGIGMLLVILGGFGMLARLGIHWPFPYWVIIKAGVWLFLGAYLSIAYRSTWGATRKVFGVLIAVMLATGVVLMK